MQAHTQQGKLRGGNCSTSTRACAITALLRMPEGRGPQEQSKRHKGARTKPLQPSRPTNHFRKIPLVLPATVPGAATTAKFGKGREGVDWEQVRPGLVD